MADATSDRANSMPSHRREPDATFEGFEHERIESNGITINLRQGGNGPPLLLLHGNPLTHVSWHKIAPRLAQDFTVGHRMALDCPEQVLKFASLDIVPTHWVLTHITREWAQAS